MVETYGLGEPLPDSAEAAELEIDAIFFNKEHPYYAKPGNPMRERAQERVNQLFVIKCAGKLSRIEQICEDGLAEQKEREATAQAALVKDYRQIVKDLKDANFDADLGYSDEEIRPFLVSGLKQEQSLHLGDYKRLSQLLTDDMRGLPTNPEMQRILGILSDEAYTNGNAETIKMYGGALIKFIYDKKNEKSLILDQQKKAIQEKIHARRT